jgi:hypothetical protein
MKRKLATHGTAILACLFALAVFSLPLHASTLEIQFTGLDLDYDGTNIFDAGVHNTVGNGDPADADALTSMNFYVDGNLVGVLNTDVFVDVYIANVGAMPIGGGLLTSSGNGGAFGVDLLTSNNQPGWGLALNIDTMQFFYTGSQIAISVAGLATSIFAQQLPFALAYDTSQPVTIVMSSANLTNVATAGGFVTSLEAAGTGNVAGIYVPEPSTFVLLGIGCFAAAIHAVRRRRR